MHVIENLRMGFIWSCHWAISVICPKDNGMITKWVWKLLITILAGGGGCTGQRGRGVQGNPQVPSE